MDIPLFHPIILVIFMLWKKIDLIGILIFHYYNNLIIAFEENWVMTLWEPSTLWFFSIFHPIFVIPSLIDDWDVPFIYPLVNVYITNWNITIFNGITMDNHEDNELENHHLSWENQL